MYYLPQNYIKVSTKEQTLEINIDVENVFDNSFVKLSQI